jgi:hypothetical protein
VPEKPHAPAHLAGHGALVVPRAGYQLERVEGGPDSALRVTNGSERGLLDVRAPERETNPLAEVLLGPPTHAWRIETRAFVCAWPRGFVLADDPDGLSPFLLAGPRDSLVWVSGPMPRERALPIEQLVDEGQRVRAIADAPDSTRLDVDYVVEGEPWWQRRTVLRWDDDTVMVVSAQARMSDEESVCAAVDEVAETLTAAQLN